MKNKLCAIIVAGLLTAPASLQAAVIYDNFGPGNEFDTSGWVSVGGDSAFGAAYTWGMAFAPTTSGFLESIEFAMTIRGYNAFLDISVFSDNEAHPGELVESIKITMSSADGEYAPGIAMVEASGTARLFEGQTYWLVISADRDADWLQFTQTWIEWHLTSPVVSGSRYQAIGVNPGNVAEGTIAAFRVNSAADSVSVAEPGVLALFGIGLIGMGLARRRRT